jgi:hypothetical protein
VKLRSASSQLALLSIVVAFFVTALASTANERKVQFFAEGDLFCESKLAPPGKLLPKTVTHFRLNCEGRNWQIETERTGKDSRTGEQFELKFVVGTTNSDIFAVSYHRRNGTTNWICLNGSAWPGPVPYVLMEPSIEMLWIALISQSYYTNSGRQMLTAMFFPYQSDLYNARFSMPADVNRSDISPHFLYNLTGYLDEWRYWDEPPDALIMPPLERPLPSPYEKGCTNFIYTATDFVRGDTMAWPAQFDFAFYGMKSGAHDSSDLRIVALAHGVVTTFLNNTNYVNVPFIPQVEKGTLVDEGRFIVDEHRILSFNYISPGMWQTKAEVAASPEYKSQMQRQARSEPLIKSRPHIQTLSNAGAYKKQAWMALIFLTCFSIIPIVLYLVRSKVQRQTNNRER